MQWYFNKTEIGSLLFSKYAFFVVVVNVYLVQRKKKHYNFSEFIVIEIVFLCLVAWRNNHWVSRLCSPARYTVQGHICCFKASFLQMVVQECMHTVLMKEYLRWLHRLADLLSFWLLGADSLHIFLLKGIVSCHTSTKLQLWFKTLSRLAVMDYMTYSSREGQLVLLCA